MPVDLPLGQADRGGGFRLVQRDGGQRAADQVAHLRRSPEGEYQDSAGFPVQVPAEQPGKPEIHDIQQHQLRHKPDDLQPYAAEDLRDLPAGKHQQAEQQAQRAGKADADQRDAQRDPQPAEEALEVDSLKQDGDPRILHSAASFPPASRSGKPGAGAPGRRPPA